MISIEGKPGVHSMDTIEYEDKLWLVTKWSPTSKSEWHSPAFLVCLSYLPHAKTRDSEKFDFVLNNKLPKSVYEGHISPELKNQFLVIENPDIKVRLPEKKDS